MGTPLATSDFAWIEKILNTFPEVTWDRWTQNLPTDASFFGWIAREDGRSDYVLLMLDDDGPWLVSTSSARYSAEFSARCGFGNHTPCQRVEHDFPNVKSVQLDTRLDNS